MRGRTIKKRRKSMRWLISLCIAGDTLLLGRSVSASRRRARAGAAGGPGDAQARRGPGRAGLGTGRGLTSGMAEALASRS